MRELDPGYKNIIGVILNLNHDRYKSYFNYFIILNLGIITAIGSEFGACIECIKQFLSIVGIVLSIAWLLVLFKIFKDIKGAWSAIEQYEKSDKYDGIIKISETTWKCYSASKIMFIIPLCFITVYIFVLIA